MKPIFCGTEHVADCATRVCPATAGTVRRENLWYALPLLIEIKKKRKGTLHVRGIIEWSFKVPCAYAHAIKRVILDGNYGSMSCDESQTKWAVAEYAQVLSFSLFLLSRFLRWCQPHTYHTPAFLILLIFKTTDVSPPYSSGDVDIVDGKGEHSRNNLIRKHRSSFKYAVAAGTAMAREQPSLAIDRAHPPFLINLDNVFNHIAGVKSDLLVAGCLIIVQRGGTDALRSSSSNPLIKFRHDHVTVFITMCFIKSEQVVQPLLRLRLRLRLKFIPYSRPFCTPLSGFVCHSPSFVGFALYFTV